MNTEKQNIINNLNLQRELVLAGFEFKEIDEENAFEHWSFKSLKIVKGLDGQFYDYITNIKVSNIEDIKVLIKLTDK